MNRRIILPWSLILQIKVHYGEILFRYIFKEVMNHTGIQDSCSVFIFLRFNIFFRNKSCWSKNQFVVLSIYFDNSIYSNIWFLSTIWLFLSLIFFLICWLSFSNEKRKQLAIEKTNNQCVITNYMPVHLSQYSKYSLRA